MSAELRTRLEQRIPIGNAYVPVCGLGRAYGSGKPGALAMLEPTLRWLSHGGPWVRWYSDDAVDALADQLGPDDVTSAAGLARALVEAVRAEMVHLEHIEDDLERFTARISIQARERFGIRLGHITDRDPAWCRLFSTTLSRLYADVARRTPKLQNTAVLFVMGMPSCGDGLGLHAWNWLVDYAAGTIETFDPQNDRYGDAYANSSALLYTLACARQPGAPVPGARLLVRRADSLHGGTLLFHLARHPISRASRWAIAARLRAGSFHRVVPDWEQNLADCDAAWAHDGVDVRDLIAIADG